MDLKDYFIDVTALPETTAGTVQLLFVGSTYGYILYYASNLISDGAELLLLIPAAAGLVGSVVLPVLGAVPDGCMVLFSGLGPDAQSQLDVGIGTLAGSTIMLLTLPWFLSIVGGRVNIDPFSLLPDYRSPKLTPQDNWDLFSTGVSVSPSVHMEAYVMMLTALTYLLLQLPGLAYLHNTVAEQAEGERMFAYVGAVCCLVFFCGYLYLQYLHCAHPDGRQEQARDEVVRTAIAQKKVTLLGVMMSEYQAEVRESGAGGGSEGMGGGGGNVGSGKMGGGGGGVMGGGGGVVFPRTSHTTEVYSHKSDKSERTPLTSSPSPYSPSPYSPPQPTSTYAATTPGPDLSRYMRRLRSLLRPFFRAYDKSKEGWLNLDELRMLLLDMGESLSKAEVAAVFARFDRDHDGRIDYDEFVAGVSDYVLKTVLKHKPGLAYQTPEEQQLIDLSQGEGPVERGGYGDGGGDLEEGDEEEEEADEIPDDMQGLSPQEQQSRIKWRALQMLSMGTLLVIVISDPMVDVLSELGRRSGIPAFYVAFVLAPMASNASELVAAYRFAAKKTRASISISMATLLGAAIMNNTFVLGIFMLLVATQGLSWEFFAETLVILLVQLAVAIMAMLKTHRLIDGYMLLSLYPLSLAAVWLLERAGWD